MEKKAEGSGEPSWLHGCWLGSGETPGTSLGQNPRKGADVNTSGLRGYLKLSQSTIMCLRLYYSL